MKWIHTQCICCFGATGIWCNNSAVVWKVEKRKQRKRGELEIVLAEVNSGVNEIIEEVQDADRCNCILSRNIN